MNSWNSFWFSYIKPLVKKLLDMKASAKILTARNYLLVPIIVLISIVIFSGINEMKQSTAALMVLTKNQARAMMETLVMSSQNSITAQESIEKSVKGRLLDNAGMLKMLYEQGKLSNSFLKEYANSHELFRINIFNSSREMIMSNVPIGGTSGGQGMKGRGFGKGRMMGKMGWGGGNGGRNLTRTQELPELDPIFNGTKDTLIIGLKNARFNDALRYVVALKAKGPVAIVVNTDEEQMSHDKKEGALAALVKNISSKKDIAFFILQDANGIIAATDEAPKYNTTSDSVFIAKAIGSGKFNYRLATFNNKDVLEAIQSFSFPDNSIGVIRIGIPLDLLEQLKSGILNRIILNAVFLFLAGALIILFFHVRQNYRTLEGQFKDVESFSSGVIETVNDAIIVYNERDGIKIFNKAAEKLFELQEVQVINKRLSELPFNDDLKRLFDSQSGLEEYTVHVGGKRKQLMVSKSGFLDSENTASTIIVVRDFTEFRTLEMQLQRKERLTAMGSLASGVAHEVRNPLNSIGTIAQQLDKDFTSVENTDEYHKLVKIIYSEVKRIDKTVSNFLKFAKPEVIHPEYFNLSEFFEQISGQFVSELGEKGVALSITVSEDCRVRWDRNQIQQVVINLIRNSVEAMKRGGNITIMAVKQPSGERPVEIIVEDNGPGIPAEILPKIFNLYFTTKPEGTGIGLSVVQKIIDEHGGIIFIDSSIKEGTSIHMQMPLEIGNV